MLFPPLHTAFDLIGARVRDPPELRHAFIRLPCTGGMFLAKPMKGCRTKYRRAEALRFAVEELRIPKAYGAWLEVG